MSFSRESSSPGDLVWIFSTTTYSHARLHRVSVVDPREVERKNGTFARWAITFAAESASFPIEYFFIVFWSGPRGARLG